MRIFTTHSERTARIARWTTALFVIFVLTSVLSSAVSAQSVSPVRSDVEDQQDLARKGEAVPEVRDSSARPSAPLAATPNSANYAFTNATNGTFTDMSGGNPIMAAGQDDVASPVTPIGFDFYFMGQRFDSFTVSSNGIIRLGTTAIGTTTYALAQAGQSLIAAAGSDMVLCSLSAPASQGRIVYKVIGAAPNRTLVFEFRNVSIIFPAAPATSTPDGTYQVRLTESTGQIELLYGSMFRNAGLGFSGGNQPINIGFSSGNTDGTYATVTSATGVVTTTGAPTSNLYTLGASIANLNSPVEGSRRIYTFLPPAPTAPTGLNFTGVTQTDTTLNWTDSANEVGYGIYRSTDAGATFTFVATVAGDSTTFGATGLLPGTSYTWRVAAFNEGRLSNLDGVQATTAAGTKNATTSGLWSQIATWGGNPIPTATDDVTILTGQNVTIDVAAVANKVSVQSGGVLQYDAAIVSSLTVTQNVTIDSGGTFQSNPAGTVTTHSLSVGTDLTNNGTLDFSTNGNTAAAGITFTGATNNSFGGTGATTDIRTLTVNKGTSIANTLELTATNFTVQGVTTDVAGFLTLTNGTFKISGSFTGTNRVFTAAAYTIGATTGIWLNNTNYTIAGQAGSPTNNGLLRLSLGTFNIGTIAGNAMAGGLGSIFIIEGGTLNASGRLLVAGAFATYTQTGGTVNATTVGNASSATAGFGFTSATDLITFGGGTINLVNRATGATILDYNVAALFTGTALTTLNIGTGATATNFNFAIQGNAPIVNIDNTGNNKTLNLNGTTRVFGNLTIPTGTALNCVNAAGATGTVMIFFGTAVSNNGAITGPAAASRFDFQGALAQTYSGSGTFGTNVAPFGGVGVSTANSNPASVTLNAPIVTNRVNLFFGDIHNANQITLGNGGASTTVVQIGQAANTNIGGSFDVSPTHNQGTGGQILLYLQETASRTTGVELNPTRILTSMTVDNTNNLNIAGGNLTSSNIATALTLTNGRVITGPNTVILSSGTATVTRTNGYIDGNFMKTYTAAGSKLFEVGTANGFSPVTVNATAGTFPANFTAKAVQGPQPSVNPATSIQRYWTLTNGGLTSADLTFQYLLADVMGTEANYKVIRVSGGTAVAFPTSTVNTVAHTASLTGATGFSDWTVGEISAPTAAPATISGQVTTASGAPLAGVVMNLSGARSARTITDSNGNYRFAGIDTDNFYTVTPATVNYHFSPLARSFSLLANRTDATFTGTLDGVISGNVIDTPEYFVRQHYLDFLGREPDQSGLNFWSDQISGCGNDFNCLERRTINVSAAYFLSIEFRETGGLVNGLYQASYGRAPRFNEFTPDTARVARAVIVGESGWQERLATNKQEFLDAWVERAAFRAAYDNLANDGYVDTLISHTDVSFTAAEREGLVNGLAAGTLTRAQVLQRVAQNERFVKAKFNEAFVRMQYFGYLRRDPDDSGFHFWLQKLNDFDGNFERAEMVKAFIISGEYRDRFRQH